MKNEWLIRMGIAALIRSIKNEEKKAKMRPYLKQAFHAIGMAFADDPTFADPDED